MFSQQLAGRERVNATHARCDNPQAPSVYARKREIQILEPEDVDKRIRRYPCSAPLGMTCRSVHPVRKHGTGKVYRMKEPYGEGLASHTGSESCGHDRKVRYEA